MQPERPSIWSHDSNETASGKPGTLQTLNHAACHRSKRFMGADAKYIQKSRRTDYMEFPRCCLACGCKLSTNELEYARSTIGLKDFAYARCGNCGSLVGEGFDRSALYEYRDSTNYAETERKLLRQLKEIFIRLDYREFLGSIKPGDLVVDYGCGSGELSNTLESLGFNNIVAVDLQPERPRNLCASVRYVQLSEVKSLQAKYIFARHVWEHIEDPAAALFDLRSKISSECLVVIEVPNAGSFFRTLMKRRWPGYFAPFHTIIFSKRGLQNLVERSGFQLVTIREKESPIIGSFLAEVGLPRTVARLASAAMFPLQKLVSIVTNTGEAVIVVIRSDDRVQTRSEPECDGGREAYG